MTPEEFEAKLVALTRRVVFVEQKLDEARRRIQLSPILDDQVIAINARTGKPQSVA